jgi:hypothetical protein
VAEILKKDEGLQLGGYWVAPGTEVWPRVSVLCPACHCIAHGGFGCGILAGDSMGGDVQVATRFGGQAAVVAEVRELWIRTRCKQGWWRARRWEECDDCVTRGRSNASFQPEGC